VDGLENLKSTTCIDVPYQALRVKSKHDADNGADTATSITSKRQQYRYHYLLDLELSDCYSTLDEYLDEVFADYDLTNCRVICIDGTNGTGKTTLCQRNNRLHVKINSLFPRITSSSDYNHNPVNAKRYILCKNLVTFAPEVQHGGICWDRDKYSNLRWQYVHQLIDHYSSRGRDIPVDDEFEVFGVLNNLATRNNLCDILEYLENEEEREITLTLTCRNVAFVATCMLERALTSNIKVAIAPENHIHNVIRDERNVINNDAFNAKEFNYNVAQNYVYYYFAKLKRDPCIDVSCIYEYFTGLTIEDFQSALLQRINYRCAISPNQLLFPNRLVHIGDQQQHQQQSQSLACDLLNHGDEQQQQSQSLAYDALNLCSADDRIQHIYNTANDLFVYQHSAK